MLLLLVYACDVVFCIYVGIEVQRMRTLSDVGVGFHYFTSPSLSVTGVREKGRGEGVSKGDRGC